MIEPVTPPDEAQRLAALRALDLLDTPPEQRFDRLTEAAARALDAPIAYVSLVDADRQWFKSKVGLDATETPRAASFCGHTILDDAPLVVPDAREDPRFHDNPLVEGEPHVRFYAGHPLTTLDGQRVGTLCVVDRRPHQLSSAERAALRALAAAASDELSAHRVKLGSYRLLEVIGRGGMGVVYRAHDEALGRTVAVKLVLREHQGDAPLLERFRREGLALAAVSHPCVLTVYALGEAHGAPYMVSEFLPGGTLAARLKAGPLPPREVARLGASLASALDALEEAGLVHRDVKPANVLFDARGRPRLGDFGLVRQVGGARSGRLDPARLRDLLDEAERVRAETAVAVAATVVGGVTDHGGLVGTILYMAPEQARGEGVDARADLWGLGATLHHALTGAPPHGPRPREALERLLAGARPPAPATDAPPLARVLARLLDPDPAARGTALQAEQDLREAARALAAP